MAHSGALGRRWPEAGIGPRPRWPAVCLRRLQHESRLTEKMAARSAIPFRVNQSYLTNAAASHSTFLKKSLVYPHLRLKIAQKELHDLPWPFGAPLALGGRIHPLISDQPAYDGGT